MTYRLLTSTKANVRHGTSFSLTLALLNAPLNGWEGDGNGMNGEGGMARWKKGEGGGRGEGNGETGGGERELERGGGGGGVVVCLN